MGAHKVSIPGHRPHICIEGDDKSHNLPRNDQLINLKVPIFNTHLSTPNSQWSKGMLSRCTVSLILKVVFKLHFRLLLSSIPSISTRCVWFKFLDGAYTVMPRLYELTGSAIVLRTLDCSTSLSSINEYLTIDSGGYLVRV